jgi:aspartyl-tRNA(Asn)/glutamyl-tRNA(Gln) amidotransferase subunit A
MTTPHDADGGEEGKSTPDNWAANLTIARAAARLRGGDLTAVELVEACLRRIARVDPIIQACVTVMADAALEQARVADQALQAREGWARRAAAGAGPYYAKPLLGIPLAVKDLIATRGVLTTGGSRVLDDWIPAEDATVVTLLRLAGAVPVCKTNTHEFAYGTVTAPTRNPWNPAHGPGGSSGGSAAAVAAGEALGALGTDTGGSIRIPVGWCGVTGLKPTYGLVGRAGIIPLSWSYDHAGPIAWTVEDCALLLDALAGYDPHDPDSLEVPLPSYRAALATGRTAEDAVRGTRLGIPTSYFFAFLDDEVEGAVRAAIRIFEGLGATVVDVPVPDDMEELFDAAYRGVQRPEAYTYHADQGWLTTRAERYAPEVRANIERGGAYTAADYIRAQQWRRAFTERMRAALGEVDVLLTPTVAIPAPPLENYEPAFVVHGKEIPAGSLRLTFPFNVTGQPALALPCGFSAAGLPISMQLVAAHFNEATLLRLGHAYQRATVWHTRRPALDA